MVQSTRYKYKKRPARTRNGLSFGEWLLLAVALVYLLLYFRQEVPMSYSEPEYAPVIQTTTSRQLPRQLEL